ncbi:hypothetical protein E2C01_000269 [Portunus trituberculatus]|uniref:Uncharacterized protein n=1 Tax=Portunus trituberculatus TaxID=210409 RepID=A0A5B7CG73_PORTR|nr:hypothetical protein [Portunus trituberculatus]
MVQPPPLALMEFTHGPQLLCCGRNTQIPETTGLDGFLTTPHHSHATASPPPLLSRGGCGMVKDARISRASCLHHRGFKAVAASTPSCPTKMGSPASFMMGRDVS